MWLRGLPI
ncbi:hypothetical protein VULLAG_LOCUS19051 [Vulpes lagopus]